MDYMVYKFGGSSLADADCYRRVTAICADATQPLAVVVSAMGGMTDALLALVEKAVMGESTTTDLETIATRIQTCTDALGVEPLDLSQDLAKVGCVLDAARLTGIAGQEVKDLVSGCGELWSVQLLVASLKANGIDALPVDARDVLVAQPGPLGVEIDWQRSADNIEPIAAQRRCLVVTGFIARKPDGSATTLGRNGSDYSATAFGRLLGARQVHIFTDVDGMMSADPRLVPDARVLAQVSYSEAMELAYFGAGVLHPRTLQPAMGQGIEVLVRNTFNPDTPGTRVAAGSDDEFSIKGITAVRYMALIAVEGSGMMGVPGIARRLFGALKRGDISVVMISQASSEQSICLAVNEADSERAVELIEDEFSHELTRGQLQGIGVHTGQSVVAAVGDAMVGQPGVAARFFGALANSGVNVRAVAQGSSERNISAVIDDAQTQRAIRAIHAAYYLSPQTLSIGVIGTGHVGGALVDQLLAASERLQRRGIDLRVRGLLRSQLMWLGDQLPVNTWRKIQVEQASDADIEGFIEHVHAEHLPHAVVIDCTADDDIADQHALWLARGIHVITPNKKAQAGPGARFQALRLGQTAGRSHYLYETTVGAGLPVIQTLRDLVETGDRVRSVEAILSGTLAYLFNRYDGSVPFSTLVEQAWQQGYTEPDPRDDLSGMDVARKLMILLREIGQDVELDQLQLSAAVPVDATGSAQEFVANLSQHDAAFAEQFEQARANGQVLRYVARWTEGGAASVGLEAVDADHAMARSALTDNVIRFSTDRYSANPLVVQGPGAGPEVTAGGVFAVVLRLCTALGARP
ncbi:MAG: bifunctional aspartokinase I/homoserine dehydrogenase I [Lysobacteraceae bacterium]|nr:MAG: bifunctional aspartokinase I/homoserine dehydrogenase I [Xanthomonadaceae bacterium]